MKIGLISDTHGLLRKSAVTALKKADIIIHAGDIDTPEVLTQLSAIARVYPVRGNMDRHPEMKYLPVYEIVEAGGIFLYVIHDLMAMDFNPAAGMDVVVSGHSHAPKIAYRGRVLYINPGSAGPKRFQLPISLGMLEIKNGKITPQIIELDG
jgi:putative phosphoesterase